MRKKYREAKDYKVSTVFEVATGNLTNLMWKNELGKKEAPGDFPAEVTFNAKGVPVSAHWYKNGKPHRDGGKASVMLFHDGSLTHLAALSFFVDGKAYRENGRPPRFDFDSDKTPRDPEGNIVPFEGFDKSWLPSPIPTLIIPSPLVLPQGPRQP